MPFSFSLYPGLSLRSNHWAEISQGVSFQREWLGMSDQQPRKFIDCREYPSEKNCSLRISGTEDEVIEMAMQHATMSHGHENGPELREELRRLLKDE